MVSYCNFDCVFFALKGYSDAICDAIRKKGKKRYLIIKGKLNNTLRKHNILLPTESYQSLSEKLFTFSCLKEGINDIKPGNDLSSSI